MIVLLKEIPQYKGNPRPSLRKQVFTLCRGKGRGGCQDWVIENCKDFFKRSGAVHGPVELEFSRLELDKGVTSKRKINALVESVAVDGFDDPRLVTLAGLRRRGFTPSALKKFCEEAGLSKSNAVIPFSRIEDFLRLDLDATAPRRIVVADPVALDIVGGPERSMLVIANHPKDESMGVRPFEVSDGWWISRDDVRAEGMAEKGFKRVEPGAIFRIMPGVIVECIEVIVGSSGLVDRIIAKPSEGKPRCTLHGLSRSNAKDVEIWEPDTLRDADAYPEACLKVSRGYVEPCALETLGTWHAVRYGYCTVDRNDAGRIIVTTKLRSSV